VAGFGVFGTWVADSHDEPINGFNSSPPKKQIGHLSKNLLRGGESEPAPLLSNS
jgi:hypothetical protein